jgi:hypothetical protein
LETIFAEWKIYQEIAYGKRFILSRLNCQEPVKEGEEDSLGKPIISAGTLKLASAVFGNAAGLRTFPQSGARCRRRGC